MEKFIEELCGKKLNDEAVRMMSPVKLAYIGDAVFELYIRTYVINSNKGHVKDLNKDAVKFVSAVGQSKVARNLDKIITEEEMTILKRGRNQKSLSAPKNTSIGDYKYATGFESLLGYLFLMGNIDRIRTIIIEAIKMTEINFGDKNEA
jgi:ribonuclease-3 family protein